MDIVSLSSNASFIRSLNYVMTTCYALSFEANHTRWVVENKGQDVYRPATNAWWSGYDLVSGGGRRDPVGGSRANWDLASSR